MKRYCLLIGLVTIAGSLTAWAADSLDQWQWRNPLPDYGCVIQGVVYANGSFLAVGDDGVTLSSPNGTNWTLNRITPADGFAGVAYGGGMYAAVGYHRAPDQGQDIPVILTSSNGLNWAVQDSPDPMVTVLYAVTYGNGLFVAVGLGVDLAYEQGYGAILTSPDGLNWTSQQSGVGSMLLGVAYGSGLYVAVGEGGEVLSSPDGQSWNSWVSRDPYFMDQPDLFVGLNYVNGMFLAISQGDGFLTSPDGNAWTRENLIGGPFDWAYLREVAYGNGEFVAAGGQALVSSDGATWSPYSLGAGSNSMGVAFGNGMFVAAGQGTLLGSGDGTQWTNLLSPEIFCWRQWDVVYGNGLFVALSADGTTLRSDDGVQWTAGVCPIPTTVPALTFGQGLFVAAGDNQTIATSADGAQWTLCNSGGSAHLEVSAIYANGLFVVGGDQGTILSSTDGTNWTASTPGAVVGAGGVWDLAYGNGTFVAVCYDGSLLTSPDGINWSSAGSASSWTSHLAFLAFGNGTFVALGNYSYLWSTNGVDWSPARSGTEQVANPSRVRFVGGTFVAVGDRGGILSSANGMDWVSHNSGTERTLTGVAYGGGAYVVVGPYGTILESGVASPWSLSLGPVAELTNGACAVTIQGAPAHNWELQASSNLVSWVPLMSVFCTNTSLQFIDYDATNYSRRFYRALGW